MAGERGQEREAQAGRRRTTSRQGTTAPPPCPATGAAAQLGIGIGSEPHHDTGPAYLLGERAGGATLTARLWVPTTADHRVILRQVVDGEPVNTEMEPAGRSRAGTWWQGPVRLVNPVNRYRFLILEPDSPTPYRWLHAAGVSDHDVPDATDFQVLPHDDGPAWVPDAVAYQIFPDRFAPSARGARRPAPQWAQPHGWLDEPPAEGDATAQAWYGGDLDGIAEHLDWLESLGIDTVYLTPVFPAGSVHRYDSTTFDEIDPLLGGAPALERLSRALHARGMRLILDLTTNHTGEGHEWFRSAQASATSTEAGFYSFSRHPDQYASWLDVPSLPKLDHRSQELRRRLLLGRDSAVGRWLAPPVSADGWRVDVANMTGRLGMVDLAHQVAGDMRATMGQAEADDGRQRWLVAEHGHDASADLQGPGWHGTMNYLGFTKPLWAWLSDPDPADGLTWLGLPMPLPHLGGRAVVAGMRQYLAQMPTSSLERSMNMLCSHDTPRVRTVVGSRPAHLVAATALFTMAGVPTIFSGDELGARGRTGEHSRTTIPWARDERGALRADEVEETGSWGPVDRAVLDRYRRLSRLRRDLVALRRGGTRFLHAGPDMIVWLRTHPQGDVLVALARSACDELVVPLERLPAQGPDRTWAFDAVEIGLTAGGSSAQLSIRAHGPGSAVAALLPWE
ncbi:alpha-amylase family glycosyl hydrolase [Actinomyces bowdenii]|uniref:Glycoside hydrolase family 13 protein n=1 Tax=Actinomyces bowdenii TaxID=131109 RepID=A0A3P1V7D4_9ACTO|nr:alpha-amylase family glycosyl hydrolase [Actinomyces bowdenii]RRD29255.1 glycoside hydrolase family 13 protein [Actinomyces bowdenii]